LLLLGEGGRGGGGAEGPEGADEAADGGGPGGDQGPGTVLADFQFAGGAAVVVGVWGWG